MSDAKRIAALQRQASDAEVERLRLVERAAHIRGLGLERTRREEIRTALNGRISDLEAQLSASHLAAQRLAVEAVAEERERWAPRVAGLKAALLRRCPSHCENDHEPGTCHLTRAEVEALATFGEAPDDYLGCRDPECLRCLAALAARGGK